MTIRDEYEYLKTELMVKLTDVTVMCNLDFPFDLRIPKEEESRYFIRGVQTRLATKKSMIILDNTYKKVRLFPGDDIVQVYTETQDEILEAYKKDVMTAFTFETWRFMHDDYASYEKYIDSLIERIKEASKPYIEELAKLTPKDIEREIAQKDALNKSMQGSQQFNINLRSTRSVF